MFSIVRLSRELPRLAEARVAAYSRLTVRWSAAGSVGPDGRAWNVAAVGTDRRSVHRHIHMAGGAGGQQGTAQPGCGRGQDVDALVQIPVAR